jgi:hypothetical protein
MVRLTGEGATGDGCTWALRVAKAANATSAAQAVTVLYMMRLPTFRGRFVALLDSRAACPASSTSEGHSNSMVE